MNQNQKYVLIGVVVVLILQLIFFTPFTAWTSDGQAVNQHGNIFSPPSYAFSVNVSQFIIYWFVILIFGGIAFYLAKGPKKE